MGYIKPDTYAPTERAQAHIGNWYVFGLSPEAYERFVERTLMELIRRYTPKPKLHPTFGLQRPPRGGGGRGVA